MVCNKDWVEKDTEAAAATLRAITRAMKLMKDNPQAAKVAAKKAFPDLEDDIFNAAFADNLAAFPASPLVQREQMERALDFHHKTGGTPLTVDVAATFTNRAVERAQQTLR
jgi:ABC-type nitrate/sulfonate/bicarbonate transport system substrate-binding protein